MSQHGCVDLCSDEDEEELNNGDVPLNTNVSPPHSPHQSPLPSTGPFTASEALASVPAAKKRRRLKSVVDYEDKFPADASASQATDVGASIDEAELSERDYNRSAQPTVSESCPGSPLHSYDGSRPGGGTWSAPADSRAAKKAAAAAKKAAAAAQRVAKKAASDADKAAKVEAAALKKAAKVAESRAKGTKALEEIEVVMDTNLLLKKWGRDIMDAIEKDSLKVVLEAGRIPGVDTISWRRIDPVGSQSADPTEYLPLLMAILPPETATELLGDEARMSAFIHSIPKACGPVTLSLVTLNLERHLITRERKEHDTAMRSGRTGGTFQKKPLMERLLQLHFKYQGIIARDVLDNAQAAEHVVGATTALALQPYKGGEEWLAAYSHRQKVEKFTAYKHADKLSQQQGVCARALYGMQGIAPKEACTVALQYPSLGSLMQHLTSKPEAAACTPIATLKTSTGRQVGQAAAKKLHEFLTSEDPDTPFRSKM